MTDLECVQQDRRYLRRVKEQTPEICLAAVKQNGFALQYVEKQTPEIVLTAIANDSEAFTYVSQDIWKKMKEMFDMLTERKPLNE